MTPDDPMFEWLQSPDNEFRLVLMRGVPGSGKSFRAREIAGDVGLICSADDFFGKTKEEYIQNWSIDKLDAAHKECQKKCRMAMQQRHNLVIVDNTNTRLMEMHPYFDLAVQYQYRVEIEEPTSPWWLNDVSPYLLEKQNYPKELEKAAKLLFEKNQHGVPLASIEKMLNRYQPMVLFSDLSKAFCRRYPLWVPGGRELPV